MEVSKKKKEKERVDFEGLEGEKKALSRLWALFREGDGGAIEG